MKTDRRKPEPRTLSKRDIQRMYHNQALGRSERRRYRLDKLYKTDTESIGFVATLPQRYRTTINTLV